MVRSRRWGPAAALVLALVAGRPARALETDQYWAWGKPLADAGDAIDAKIDSEIAFVLEDANAHGARCSCRTLQRRIWRRLRYLIFLKPELWTVNTSLVEKIPGTPKDELGFRRDDIYARGSSAFDVLRWMPPSPTIEVNGIRFGTDKLSHFFSEGAWLHVWYRSFRKKGISKAEAEKRAVLRGILTERTILGGTSSGVASLADMEANYQGMLFWNRLCLGPDPLLVRTAAEWRMREGFDLASMVSPEWDESWQPNIYAPMRWKKVEPVLRGYCDALRSPWVRAERAAYAKRDRLTLTERIVGGLVEEGRLSDPWQYTIDAVCGLPRREVVGTAASQSVPRRDHEP